MSNYIVPILFILIVVYANFKRVNNYNSFVKGAKKSFELIFDIFGYIVAIFIVIELFNASGISDYLCSILTPIFNFLNIPNELTEFIVIKPFSGSGGLAMLSEIFATYGADSYIGRCASVIMASSETVFYVATVYFSKTSVKKLGIAIPIALIANVICAIVACLFCRLI
jgi:spore maturation protein B